MLCVRACCVRATCPLCACALLLAVCVRAVGWLALPPVRSGRARGWWWCTGAGLVGGCVRGACGVQYGSSHRTEHGPTATKTRISMHALRRAKTHTGMRLGGVAHLDANKGYGPPYGKRAWSTQTGSAHAASLRAPPML